jgi:4-amino-4-deoxychorismate lyase
MIEFFETIKIKDKKIYNLFYHQKRYETTIKKFNGKIYNLADFIKPPDEKLYRCKIIYDEKGINDVSFYRYEQKKPTSFKIINIDFDYSFKYLNRDNLEKAFSNKKECDDIIMVKDNLITDTFSANIAFYHNNKWITPKTPLLRGTTRERYLQKGLLHAKDIRVEDLSDFKKIALMNAMIDFYEVDFCYNYENN